MSLFEHTAGKNGALIISRSTRFSSYELIMLWSGDSMPEQVPILALVM